MLGELTCLTTAVIVLPAVLQLARRAPDPPEPAFEWDRGTAASARVNGDEPEETAPTTEKSPDVQP